MKRNQKISFSMIKSLNSLKIAFLFLLLLIPCFKLNAQAGKDNFDKLCATCHTITSKNLVGPGLAGVADKQSEEWLIKWIQNSQEFIASGDEDAIKISKEYNDVPMPAFPQLSEQEIKDIITYIAENGVADAGASSASAGGSAGTSGEDGGESLFGEYGFWFFLTIAVMGYILFRIRRKTKLALNHMGYNEENPHKVPNYLFLFVVYVGIAGLLSWFIVRLLEQDYGMINQLSFIALPYLSFGVFLIGSIYRYKNMGFKVSSLSTEFLEGNKLFWGSQAFHWSILILFFGHLIAFLFPASILAWNGSPVRLLILEFSAFAFGLTALFGVVLLIKRRLSTKTLKVVANKMDMVVYTVLLTQIISGLGVAFFVRWGSSWFSSVLSPYLASVFSFNPDIAAVSEMPWLIQLHIISAFVIIGIIPFTRFVHFLVAPIDYLWRRYQLVIWNWNPKRIRTSYRWNFGKKPRNH
ncbi:MAG: respiratory nitrate reductase subunit gamma [Brumimicrobium sp.]|nr:respiratory nitrate reductase subunit gamma [Brumimicrobium sp.]